MSPTPRCARPTPRACSTLHAITDRPAATAGAHATTTWRGRTGRRHSTAVTTSTAAAHTAAIGRIAIVRPSGTPIHHASVVAGFVRPLTTPVAASANKAISSVLG
ncbi:MAG: hypothetical protein V9G12_25925 [Microthrixaceae bacterium]